MTPFQRWNAFRKDGGFKRQFWPVLLGLVLPLLFAWRELARLGTYTVDDAYISFRYAENLVDGHGLVYNVGERVEGFTNLLWTLVLAAAYAAGGSTLLASKVLGVLGATGAIVLAFAFATRMYREDSLAQNIDASRAFPPLCLSTWALATSSAFLSHSVIGLETGSFAFLAMWGLWLLQSECGREERGQHSKPWSALVFCAACLTRPEAPLFFGASLLFMRPQASRPASAHASRWSRLSALASPASLLCFASLLTAFIVLHQSRTGHGRHWALAWLVVSGLVLATLNVRALLTRFVWVRVAMVLVLLAGLTVFRLRYYGALIPNTFLAKTGNPSDELLGGVTYLRNFFRLTQPLPYVALMGLGAGLWERRPLVLAAGALSLGGVAYILRVGSDWMHSFAT